MNAYGERNMHGIPTDPAKRNQYVRNSLGKSMMPRSDLASREEVLALSRRMKGMNAGPMSLQPEQNSNRAQAQEAQKKMEPVEDPIYSKIKDAIDKMIKLLDRTYYFNPEHEYPTYFQGLHDDVIAASESLTRVTTDSGWGKILESKPEGDPMMTALFQALDYIDYYGRNAARNLPHLTTQFVYGLYAQADIVKNILGILLNEYMEHRMENKKIGNRLNSIGAETRHMESKRHMNLLQRNAILANPNAALAGNNAALAKKIIEGPKNNSWASIAMAQQYAPPPLALKRNGTEFPGVITQPKQTFVEATQAFQRHANSVGMPLMGINLSKNEILQMFTDAIGATSDLSKIANSIYHGNTRHHDTLTSRIQDSYDKVSNLLKVERVRQVLHNPTGMDTITNNLLTYNATDKQRMKRLSKDASDISEILLVARGDYNTSTSKNNPTQRMPSNSGGRRTHRNRNRKHKRTHRNRKHKRTQRK